VTEPHHVSETNPRCRHCDLKPACLRHRTAPMLCFRCASKPRLYAQYALPADRVVLLFEMALDQMVLEAIARGRGGAEPALVEDGSAAR
jgi:hypothetical protein